MSIAMSKKEREKFLSEPHIAVMSIEDPGRGPLAAPVWYGFAADLGVWVITHETSRKGQLLASAGRYSLCVQDETPPLYKYVSIEGPVVETRAADRERDYRPMARRYFEQPVADRFVDVSWSEGNLVYRMQPEHWLTVDYAKDTALVGG